MVMETINNIISYSVQLLKLPIHFDNFTFSYWQIFLFIIFLGFIFKFLRSFR